jgi:hypothetical protein
MRFKTILAVVALTASPVVIAGDVQAFPAPGVDLSKYKTFKMLPTRVLTKTGIQENDPTYSPHIMAAVRKELTAKGLTEVAENADVDVSTGGLARAFPQLEALIFGFNWGTDWGTAPIATVGRYNKEGTVLVNLIDPRTNKSVWLGMASRAWGKPSTVDSMIAKATAQLFKKYPALNR